MHTQDLGVRWNVGDVSELGFEALRCSLWGAYHLFGDASVYAVCVNTVSIAEAKRRTGQVPEDVLWVESDARLPQWLRDHLDADLAEGVAWKLAPLRLFPDRHELSLDNDCVLWDIPDGLRAWLEARETRALVAEDVKACFGQFSAECGNAPRNLGIRGLPPGFDLERAIRRVLTRHPAVLHSELDEQGLQLAALLELGPPYVVSCEDVSICSPFPPHVSHLGLCGAHFCGLNVRRTPFSVDGVPGELRLREHWNERRARVHVRTGAP